jgi:hypothetical protein
MTSHTANREFDAVVDLFEEHRAEYLAAARAAILAFARDGRIVTVNDVIEFGPPLPDGVDPRVRGAVFQRDVWERLGYGPSDRRLSHGRPVQRFRLKGVAA